MKKIVIMMVVFFMGCVWMTADAGGKGNLRYSITVVKFKNEAGWRGQWNLGNAFTTIMTEALNASGKFIVLGDKEMRREALAEQDFVASGRTAKGKKAPKMKRMTPAQLLVRGSITHVESKTSGSKGGFSFRGIRLGGSSGKAEINITIYLVDSETGQVKASTKVVGKSGKRGLKVGYHGSALKGVRGEFAGFKKDNVGKACENAIGQGVKFLIKQLESIPWEGTIVLAKSGKILLNRGTREGVKVGTKFKVGKIEEVVDPDTGEVLDSDMTKVATIEVTRVKEKVSYCKALDGADKITKGMTVFPVK